MYFAKIQCFGTWEEIGFEINGVKCILGNEISEERLSKND
jgi:hypothetical protein